MIELLVVISIIAILMAILMPALGKVKQQADRLLCNTNLKDMGNLMGVYSQDNDNKLVSGFPYKSRWYDLLGPYYGGKDVGSGVSGSKYDIEIFKCPVEWRRHQKVIKGAATESIAAASMYAYNMFFVCPMTDTRMATFPHLWHSRTSRIQMPSDLPLFYDRSSDFSARPTNTPSSGGFEGWPHMSMYKYGWDSGNNRSTKDSETGPAVNHPGTINALFADGHAEGKGLWMYKGNSLTVRSTK